MTSIVNDKTVADFPIPPGAEQVNTGGTHNPAMGGSIGVHIDTPCARKVMLCALTDFPMYKWYILSA